LLATSQTTRRLLILARTFFVLVRSKKEKFMALNAANLKSEIVTKLQTLSGSADIGRWDMLAEAVAEAVVEHLTTNAVVNPGTLQDSVPAAITGAGTIT